MKLLLQLSILFVTLPCMAQYVEVEERPMSKGSFTSFGVTLGGQEEKDVQKEWSNFMKLYSGRTKKDRKSGEMTTDKLSMSGLGTDVLVYASSQQLGQDVVHTAWFEIHGVMLEKGDSGEDIAAEVMENFIIHMKRLKAEEEIDFQSDNLNDLTKAMERAEKDEMRATSQIEKYEQALLEAQQDLATSRQLQAQYIDEIEYQHEVLDRVKTLAMSIDLDTEVDQFIKELDAERSLKIEEIHKQHLEAQQMMETKEGDMEGQKESEVINKENE